MDLNTHGGSYGKVTRKGMVNKSKVCYGDLSSACSVVRVSLDLLIRPFLVQERRRPYKWRFLFLKCIFYCLFRASPVSAACQNNQLKITLVSNRRIWGHILVSYSHILGWHILYVRYPRAPNIFVCLCIHCLPPWLVRR